MKKYHLLFGLITFLVTSITMALPVPHLAASPSSSHTSFTTYEYVASQLSLAQLETALLEQKSLQAKYRLQVIRDRKQLKALTKPIYVPIIRQIKPVAPPVIPPKVNWVMKKNHQWVALLVLNGIPHVVKTNMKLNHGVKVMHIDNQGVWIHQHGQPHFIALSA